MKNEISERKTTKEIAIFETEGVKLEVTISPEQDTVWLSRVQMAELFDRDIKTIGKHIANASHEELKGQVVKKFNPRGIFVNFLIEITDEGLHGRDVFDKDTEVTTLMKI